jgi:hypothetical protein
VQNRVLIKICDRKLSRNFVLQHEILSKCLEGFWNSTKFCGTNFEQSISQNSQFLYYQLSILYWIRAVWRNKIFELIANFLIQNIQNPSEKNILLNNTVMSYLFSESRNLSPNDQPFFLNNQSIVDYLQFSEWK